MIQIVTVVATALLTAGLNILVNRYNTRISYRNEYHKKIIEQRMEAYGKVWALMTMFPYEYSWDRPAMEEDEIGRENYLKIYALLEDLSWNGYWLSPNLRSSVIEFYKLIASFRDWMSEEHPNFSVDQMVKNGENINLFRKRVLSSYTIDMENLHDTERFFREKRKTRVTLGPELDED